MIEMWQTTTSDTLEIILGGAVTTNQLPWTVAYGQVYNDNSTSAPLEADGLTNNTTAVTLVPAPSTNLVNELKHLNVPNVDTAAATVTIRFNNGSSTRNLITVTLQVGDQLCYTSSQGWYVLDSNGNMKVTSSGGGGSSGGNSAVQPPYGVVLDSYLKSIQLVLNANTTTNPVVYTVGYSDANATVIKAIEADGNSNGASAATLVPAPTNGHTRVMTNLSVYNADTTPKTVTTQILNNSVVRTLQPITLQVGEALYYDAGASGWYALDVNGNRK
jgi:hypothetical protein